MPDQSSWNGNPVNDIDIEIDIAALSQALLQNQKFIAAVSKAVRDQLLKDVRNKKTLFGKWGGTTQ
jgi:hypothetical protein